MDKKTILVVDDEPDFVAVVKANLEEEGYRIEIAYNGEEAIAKVRANPPDAILLDVMMPEKNGFEVCSELKKDRQYADIPIILLTAVGEHVSSTRYSHSNGLTLEADDYLSKLASPEEILEALEALMD